MRVTQPYSGKMRVSDEVEGQTNITLVGVSECVIGTDQWYCELGITNTYSSKISNNSSHSLVDVVTCLSVYQMNIFHLVEMVLKVFWCL